MAKDKFTLFRRPRVDRTGQRFGRLTVLRWEGSGKWHCRCDCGAECSVFSNNLGRNTNSCGCIRAEVFEKVITKHGLSKTPAYGTWASVKKRCLDKNDTAYPLYGGRGIGMDETWANDPAAFIRDVGQPPSSEHSLDRIDNDKGYVPGNVRWATDIEQANNKRNNRWVTFQGKRYTIAQLARYVAEECGIRPKQFLRALEKALY